jgi:uncharacterized protein (DUF849 family)
MSKPVVITCALTGGADISARKNPAVPVSPAEIASSAIDAAAAGAAVVHIHVRDPDTTFPSMELSHYREVVERIRERDADVILNLTMGAGARFVPGADRPATAGPGTTLDTPAARTRHVETLRPEMCTLDIATMNFGEHVFMNTPAHLREMAAAARQAGSKPEIEVFDLGHIELAKRLITDGHLAKPPLFQICLGIPWGAPATPDTMIQMRDRLPSDAVWSAFGISRQQFPMVALAAMLGGNVRVGLEDNLYLSAGQLAGSNAALVEKAVSLLAHLDFRPATPAEARRIFRLTSR